MGVTITLTRPIMSIMLTTLIPTTVLLVISYLSRLFREEYFDTVLQVNLTVLLVQATFFMGINQSLPTTSYMKWIDLWMIFSIIMPFLEVLAQAGYYVLKDSRSKVEPMDKPEMASSIWRLGLIGMKVTSSLVLPIGYLVFVIMWFVSGLTAQIPGNGGTNCVQSTTPQAS